MFLTSLAPFKQQAGNEFHFFSHQFYLFLHLAVYYCTTQPLSIFSRDKHILLTQEFLSPLHNIMYINIACYFQGLRVRLCVQACRAEVYEPLYSPFSWQGADFMRVLDISINFSTVGELKS